MTVSPSGSISLIKIFIRSFIVFQAVVAAWLVVSNHAAKAETGEVLVELPVYGQITYGDLMMQAEALADTAISSQFNQNPSLSNIELVVLSTRQGDVIPLITAVISRSQWQENPRVSAWVDSISNNATFALLYRFEDDHDADRDQVAQTPTVVSTSNSYIDTVAQVEEAYRQGRLTRSEYDDLIHALD